jgi:hypothetical protein
VAVLVRGVEFRALDQDLGDVEVWDHGEALGFVPGEVAPESARPVDRVEEADYDAAVDLFFDALESCSPAEELIKPGTPVSSCLFYGLGVWGRGGNTYLSDLLSLMIL